MKAFLSYPSEHLVVAKEVKNFVRSVGIECWFDKDDLVAGEDWDRARSIALRQAEVIILLCASQTISRNGVYQREVNEALHQMNDRRQGVVYIIPLRVESVTLPPEISRLQYVDYFDPFWRRKVAAGLARAVTEAGQELPAALVVAAAKPDEGGIIPRSISEENPEGTLIVNWFKYTLEGDYWEFVNGVIASRALGGLCEARRQISEWKKPEWENLFGSSWELHVSEFYRKDLLVSIILSSSNYFAGTAHPSHGVQTINILGEQGGIMTASDLFDPSTDALSFLTEYVNLDLRRQYAGTGESLDLSNYVETYGWDLFDHYNFNEKGMQLNFSSASGLPHVFGYHEVYVPWEHAGQFLAPVARKVLLKL